jgi:hypothetical protein
MRNKRYVLIVPDDIYTRYLEDFIIKNLRMELCCTGCGTTEFESSIKPRRFKERVLKNFGTCVFNRMYLREGDSSYED